MSENSTQDVSIDTNPTDVSSVSPSQDSPVLSNDETSSAQDDSTGANDNLDLENTELEEDLHLPEIEAIPAPDEVTAEQTVDYILNALNESDEKPRSQVEQIVELLGNKKAFRLLAKTYQIEHKGGLMIYNGTRRRTIGGVFFFLAQRWVDKKERPRIWPEMYPYQQFKWEHRMEPAQEVLPESGKANSVRVVLTGRPGRIIEKGRVVLTTIQPKAAPSSWPKGLPELPSSTSPYIVYITSKQWRNVRDAIRNKKDALIIEGYPTYNPQLKTMTVFSTRTTTKVLEQKRREEQRRKDAMKKKSRS